MAIEGFSPLSSVYAPNHTAALAKTDETLTTGSRVNSAADDPTASALIAQYSSQIMNQSSGVQNANMGMGALQTLDSTGENINDQLQRLNELSLQAMNGTYNPAQRNAINAEFQAGLESINQITESSQYNGINLLNGENGTMDLALGANNTFNINLPSTTTDALGLSGFSLTDPANAQLASEGLTSAMEVVADMRTQFGSQQNALTSAVDNLNTQNLNATAARSQLSDTDFTKAFSEQMRQQLLSDVGTAMQAQSNQNKGQVLSLLG